MTTKPNRLMAGLAFHAATHGRDAEAAAPAGYLPPRGPFCSVCGRGASSDDFHGPDFCICESCVAGAVHFYALRRQAGNTFSPAAAMREAVAFARRP